MSHAKKNKESSWTVWKMIGVLLATAIMVALSGVEANPEELTYNFTAMYVALATAIIALLLFLLQAFGIWYWWMAYIVAAVYAPMGLGGVVAFNWATSGMRNWTIGIPLIFTYLLAVFMPLINEKLAKRLHDEMFAPTTCLGKVVIFAILSIGPTAGSFGVFLSGIFKRSEGINSYMIFGMFAFLFLCWAVVNMVYQAWDQQPRKREE
jgi:hypothetical protein